MQYRRENRNKITFCVGFLFGLLCKFDGLGLFVELFPVFDLKWAK